MKLFTILALLIAICAIFLGVGQSEETVKIDGVKETPIKTDLTDAEKEEKQPDSFESEEANNDEDEEEGKGDDEEKNRDEKDDENDETDSSSLSENEVNDLEETLPDTKDTAALSKRSPWRRRRRRRGWGRRLVRRIKRKARRYVRRFTRKAKRFGGRVIRYGNRILGAVRNVGDKLITNQVIDIVAKKLKYMKKKMGKTCSLIKVSAGLEATIPQLSWDCEITEQKMGDEEYAGVQSDEAVGYKFREEVSENDLAKIRELIEAKEET